MKAKIEFRQTRDFGEIISDGIVFILQNWKNLLKTYAVFCGFFIAGIMIFSFLQQLRLVNRHHLIQQGQFTGDYYSTFGLEYFMVLLFAFLNGVSAILTTLCYIALYNRNGNQPPMLNEVWGYYKYYFWRVFWHCILLALIIFGGILILGMITGAITAVAGNPLVGGIVAIVIIFVPLIYILTIFSLFFPIVILENTGFGYAFGKCFRLVKGRWWNTFGVVIVSAIVVYAGFLLVSLPFSILSGGSITFLPYNVSMVMVVLYTVLMALYQILNIMPLTCTAVAYFSYAEDKESTGLMERIDTLGKMDENTEAANEAY